MICECCKMQVAYLNDLAVNGRVGVPETPIIPPLPQHSICVLNGATLQQAVHRKYAICGQLGHQLTVIYNQTCLKQVF